MGILDSVIGGTPDRSGLSAATKALLLVLAAKAAKDYMTHRQQASPPQGGAASDLHWHLEADAGRGAGRYDLVVDNHGTAHVQLTRVAATKVDGGGATVKSLSHYVLAGQSTVVPIELPPLAADASLRIEAQGDDVGATPPAVVQVPRVPVAISR